MATSNELLLDAAIRHQVQLLRFSKGEVNRAVRLLEQADKELTSLLNDKVHTEMGEARLKAMLADIRRMRAQTAIALQKQVEEGSEELAQSEAAWEVSAIESTSPVLLNLNSVSVATVKAVAGSPINGVPLAGWIGQMAQADVTRIEQAVRLGVLQGETKDQIVKRVMAAAELTRQNASTIVRTAANHISNAAAQSVWDANADILDGVRWSATLDGRTSPVCRSRDGEVYPLDKGPRPPAHPNCRSRMVPVVKGERIVGERPMVRDTRTREVREKDFRAEAREAAGDSWKGMSAAERNVAVAARRQAWTAENVGTVPSNVTYEEWLKRQPKAFQDDVLGKARAKMFRDGMSLDKFVDESGKQYSLAELKAATVGDTLNVIQPGVGLKAKALLQQGIQGDEVLYMLKKEFPDASPTAASIASYKSELKKAGLLDPGVAQPHYTANLANTVAKVEGTVSALENSLPAGVKHAVGGQWITLAEDLSGAPGVYAHYQSGKGVTASLKKLSGIPVTQAQQVLAHELGHLLHKQHQIELPGDVISSLKASAKALDPDAKKLYSYYLTHLDELTAEVYAQALSPSPITSQGLLASKFNDAFGPAIQAAKQQIAAKFPTPPAGTVALQPGAPTTPFTVAGKPTSIGSLAKALLQQGMPDEQVLLAVKAEFPNAKTGLASIASYKSELNKAKKIGGASGPTIVAHNPLPSKLSPTPPPAIVEAAPDSDPLTKLMQQAPATLKVPESQVKATGLKLMEQGVLDNSDVGSALGKLYPYNKPTPASIATWKSVWKKSDPGGFAKAKAKNVKLSSEMDAVGPTKLPFLTGKTLGAKSTSVLEQSKAKLAAGATPSEVKAFIVDQFGGPGIALPQGVDNLLELAVYQVDTAKALAKPHLAGASTYKPKGVAPAPTSFKGKSLPPGTNVGSEGDINELLEALIDEDDPDVQELFTQAKNKGIVFEPTVFKSVLSDLGLDDSGMGESLLDIVQKDWDNLPGVGTVAAKKAAAKATNAGPIDMTPTRLASTPYDGRPPPPRFSAQQRAWALKYLSGETASPAWAKKVNDRYGLKGGDRITPEEIGIIRSYTGNKTYARVNEHLRAGRYASQPAVQAYVDAAQHGLSKLPAYVGPVTRGVRWLPPGITIDQFLARYQVGSVVEEHSFLSTSRGTQAVYQGPVYFKINSKTGRDVDWLSKFSGNEKEVLMMPGTRLAITKVEKDPQGKWIIHADEVI